MCDVLFVCRNGLSLHPTLHTIRNVQSVSSPLRFHVFYDRQPRPPPPDNVSVAFYDTSEARLWSRLSPTAWSWHQQFRERFAKAHSYAAVKLFCVELLPASVERVVIMDTDVVPLVDVAGLMGWYAAVAGSDANVVVAYAQESVHFYEAVLRKGSPRKTRGLGFNGGVAVHDLARLRAAPGRRYYAALRELLKPATASQLVYETYLYPTSHALYAFAVFCGDQTVLTVADAAFPAFSDLVALVPCEWNFLMNLQPYEAPSRAALQARRAPLPGDETCREPPKILHFNNPFASAKYVASARVQRVEPALAHYVRRRLARACPLLEQTYGVGMTGRMCNTTFLLTRAPRRPPEDPKRRDT